MAALIFSVISFSLLCFVAESSGTSCTLSKLDLCFIIDSSGSIGATNWQVALKFVNDAVGGLTIGPANTEVAMVVFSTDVTVQFHLNTYTTKSDIQAAVSSTAYKSGLTNLNGALVQTSNEFLSYHRQDAAKVAVIVTDGEDNIDQGFTLGNAQALKNSGVTIVTVGVGSVTDVTRLKQIATSESYYFDVSDYSQLNSILSALLNTICPTTTPTPGPHCNWTGNHCITSAASSCTHLPDGDYQACEGCTFFHSCVAGYINYAFRDCPLTNQGGYNGKLVWDDQLKRCEYTSNTCIQCNGNTPPPIDTQPCSSGYRCLLDTANACQGKPDGDYQSCAECSKYISCVNGQRCSGVARPCPTGWRWVVTSQSQGYCHSTSHTCNNCSIDDCSTHHIRCLPETENTCSGQLDGDYQSCTSCYRYISCKDGVTWLSRPCPTTGGPWSWVITSLTQGYCHPTSQTCNSCPIVERCRTGEGCVEESDTTCHGISDGDYQSCKSCHVYISCRNGQTWTSRPCPVGSNGRQQSWTITSPTQGYCTDISATCNECPYDPVIPPGPICRSTGGSCITAASTSCSGRADGHYQACEGCTIYHSCSGGVIWPNRNCALTNQGGQNGRLVWVQVTATEGRCDYTSSTCSGSGCSASRRSMERELIEQLEEQWPKNKEPVEDEALEERSCSTGAGCIDGSVNSCVGLADGDYQDCTSCSTYHTCGGEVVFPSRLCAQGTFWNAKSRNEGECKWQSQSCRPCK